MYLNTSIFLRRAVCAVIILCLSVHAAGLSGAEQNGVALPVLVSETLPAPLRELCTPSQPLSGPFRLAMLGRYFKNRAAAADEVPLLNWLFLKRDEPPPIRLFCARLLLKSGSAEIVPQISVMLNNEREPAAWRCECIGFLAERAGDAGTELDAVFEQARSSNEKMAARALTELTLLATRNPPALPVALTDRVRSLIKNGLSSTEPEISRSALHAVGKLKFIDAFPLVEQIADCPSLDSSVRMEALRVLRAADRPEYAALLERLAVSPDMELADEARTGLCFQVLRRLQSGGADGEAAFMRLAQLGADAVPALDDFLERFPDSPHDARLRAMLYAYTAQPRELPLVEAALPEIAVLRDSRTVVVPATFTQRKGLLRNVAVSGPAPDALLHLNVDRDAVDEALHKLGLRETKAPRENGRIPVDPAAELYISIQFELGSIYGPEKPRRVRLPAECFIQPPGLAWPLPSAPWVFTASASALKTGRHVVVAFKHNDGASINNTMETGIPDDEPGSEFKINCPICPPQGTPCQLVIELGQPPRNWMAKIFRGQELSSDDLAGMMAFPTTPNIRLAFAKRLQWSTATADAAPSLMAVITNETACLSVRREAAKLLIQWQNAAIRPLLLQTVSLENANPQWQFESVRLLVFDYMRSSDELIADRLLTLSEKSGSPLRGECLSVLSSVSASRGWRVTDEQRHQRLSASIKKAFDENDTAVLMAACDAARQGHFENGYEPVARIAATRTFPDQLRCAALRALPVFNRNESLDVLRAIEADASAPVRTIAEQMRPVVLTELLTGAAKPQAEVLYRELKTLDAKADSALNDFFAATRVLAVCRLGEDVAGFADCRAAESARNGCAGTNAERGPNGADTAHPGEIRVRQLPIGIHPGRRRQLRTSRSAPGHRTSIR